MEIIGFTRTEQYGWIMEESGCLSICATSYWSWLGIKNVWNCYWLHTVTLNSFMWVFKPCLWCRFLESSLKNDVVWIPLLMSCSFIAFVLICETDIKYHIRQNSNKIVVLTKKNAQKAHIANLACVTVGGLTLTVHYSCYIHFIQVFLGFVEEPHSCH